MSLTYTPETLRLLRGGRAVIADPAHWCKGTLARRSDGTSVIPEDEAACQFCALGAVRRAESLLTPDGGLSLATAMRALNTTGRSLGYCDISDLNDDKATPHDVVLSAFDRAIAAVEAQIGGAS